MCIRDRWWDGGGTCRVLGTLEVEAPLAPANTTFEFDIGGHGGSHGSAK